MTEAEAQSTDTTTSESVFEPKILGFLCNWCCYDNVRAFLCWFAYYILFAGSYF